MHGTLPLQISLELGDPVPMALGECADAYGIVRDRRLALEAEAERIKKRESELVTHILARMTQEKETVAGGSRNRVTRHPTRTVQITDWAALTAWVAKTGNTEVLYKRVNAAAAIEVEAAGGGLPDGTAAVNGEKLTVSKA